MGCACQGGAAAGDQYQAIAADGTALMVTPTSNTGTLEQARTAARGKSGAWVRKA
jgi:hypothetical protein